MEEHSSRITRIFSDSFAIELTGKIMVIAIIILFLVLLFILILQLYTRCFSSPIDESSPDSASLRRSAINADQQPSRKGLDPALLRSLPVLVFSPEDFTEGLECAVCLSDLSQGEKARLLPICHHGFHVDCIDMWFQSNSTCPLCRNAVASGEEMESRGENLESGSSSESPIFPTNVLFWGDETQVSSRGVCLEEGLISSSSSVNTRQDGMVAVDIPNEPSTSADGETKSAVKNRLRTLKRLLSRERRVGDGSNSGDLEQVGR